MSFNVELTNQGNITLYDVDVGDYILVDLLMQVAASHGQ
ncbi:MAG: hypothetical protein IPN86_07955 [Saprospiraceae bacterium]|nr:hypothetical protein [Saprospiraceae bacterium]